MAVDKGWLTRPPEARHWGPWSPSLRRNSRLFRERAGTWQSQGGHHGPPPSATPRACRRLCHRETAETRHLRHSWHLACVVPTAETHDCGDMVTTVNPSRLPGSSGSVPRCRPGGRCTSGCWWTPEGLQERGQGPGSGGAGHPGPRSQDGAREGWGGGRGRSHRRGRRGRGGGLAVKQYRHQVSSGAHAAESLPEPGPHQRPLDAVEPSGGSWGGSPAAAGALRCGDGGRLTCCPCCGR